MITPMNYQIKEKVYETNISIIYRAIRNEDQVPVILKFLNKAYPSSEDSARLQREYEMIKDIKGRGIIWAYALEKFQNQLFIVMEDFGGESLSHLIDNQKLDLEQFLLLSIQITDALEEIHQYHPQRY